MLFLASIMAKCRLVRRLRIASTDRSVGSATADRQAPAAGFGQQMTLFAVALHLPRRQRHGGVDVDALLSSGIDVIDAAMESRAQQHDRGGARRAQQQRQQHDQRLCGLIGRIAVSASSMMRTLPTVPALLMLSSCCLFISCM